MDVALHEVSAHRVTASWGQGLRKIKRVPLDACRTKLNLNQYVRYTAPSTRHHPPSRSTLTPMNPLDGAIAFVNVLAVDMCHSRLSLATALDAHASFWMSSSRRS